MIRRKLLIATAIIASVGITACSDMTAPKKLVPGGLPGAAILAPSAASLSASSPRSGDLHVTKQCGFTSAAGPFCTITSSNLKAIELGSKILYLQPADLGTPLGSDIILYPPGPGNNTAFGHCALNFATGIGLCTFSGGTGKFTWFHASVVVSRVGEPVLRTWRWDGTYSFSPRE